MIGDRQGRDTLLQFIYMSHKLRLGKLRSGRNIWEDSVKSDRDVVLDSNMVR